MELFPHVTCDMPVVNGYDDWWWYT